MATGEGNSRRRWFLRPVVLLPLLALASVGAGVAVWEEVLEDRFVARRWGVVEPGMIYRSGQLDSALVERTLTDADIRVIVNLCRHDPDDPDQEAERDVAARHGIEYATFGLRGNGTGDIQAYADALAMMARAHRRGDPVLVHCAAGAQRTGAAVAFYRMLVQERAPSEAYREMQYYGWDARDDRELLVYINDNMEQLARLLVEREIIPQVPDPLPVFGP